MKRAVLLLVAASTANRDEDLHALAARVARSTARPSSAARRGQPKRRGSSRTTVTCCPPTCARKAKIY